MENYSVDIEKLVRTKIEGLIGVFNKGLEWVELKKYITLTKFSMDSMLKNNPDSFDHDNEMYKDFMSSFPKNMKFTSHEDAIAFIKHLNGLSIKYNFGSNNVVIDWKVLVNLQSQVEFDIKYSSIESSLISLLMKLDVMDFYGSLHALDEINAVMEGAYLDIMQSNIKKGERSYTVLHILSELYNNLDYDKKHKDDVVDSNFIESLIVSLNVSDRKFHGLVKNYLKNDVKGESNLAKIMKVSDQVKELLKSNDLNYEMVGLKYSDINSDCPMILNINAIKLP